MKRSLVVYAKQYPAPFASAPAEEILLPITEFKERSSDGQEQEESAVLVASTRECPKCVAKREGRKFTGPHRR